MFKLRPSSGFAVVLIGLWSSCLAAGQKAEPEPAKVDAEQLRLKVARNVMGIVGKLGVTDAVRMRAEACCAKESWDMTLSSFRASREKEIQEPAHQLVKSTMPMIMQQFMPKYMMAKIMADRIAKKAGPPSAEEIAKIRADAMAKMQPEMQKTIMPALEKLTKARMEELLADDKVLTRVAADRVIKSNFLDDSTIARFKDQLEKAGYPASLTTGSDSILNDRTKKMIQSIDLAAVAKKAGL